jgi:hypothetical protein
MVVTEDKCHHRQVERCGVLGGPASCSVDLSMKPFVLLR